VTDQIVHERTRSVYQAGQKSQPNRILRQAAYTNIPNSSVVKGKHNLIGSQIKFENRRQSERDEEKKTEESPMFVDGVGNYAFTTYDVDRRGFLGEKVA
jgi:hypothetical protein